MQTMLAPWLVFVVTPKDAYKNTPAERAGVGEPEKGLRHNGWSLERNSAERTDACACMAGALPVISPESTK